MDEISADQAKELSIKAVEAMEKGVEYADVLCERAGGVSVAKDNAEERVSTPAAFQGIVLRAYKLGQWRETSTYDLSAARVVEMARKLARFEPLSRNSVKLQELKPWELDEELNVKISPSEVDVEEKLKHVRRLHNEVVSHDKRVVNARVFYSDTVLERVFANTEGSVLRQVVPRISLQIVPIVRESGKMDYDYLSCGGTAGFEIVKDLEEKSVKETVDSSISLLKASAPPSGHFKVILDPGMTGTFAHESFGHGCEADQIVRKRSYLVPYFGKRIGFEKLNICDDGTLPGGNGSFLFDDEGVRSNKNYILKSGILKGFLHERYSASLMNAEPTGNGRRENFLRKLFVRMTNTYVEPGDYSFDELVEEIDYGVMFAHSFSGMEDPLAGGMELKSKKGYVIEKGRVGNVLSMLTLTENVPDFIASIDAVGKKDQFHMEQGTCGKGYEDMVPVGDGGVYIRAEAVVGQG
ncbi:MAG: TldD/PmbA family protein [Candidatus Bathyarchaeia archaeon]